MKQKLIQLIKKILQKIKAKQQKKEDLQRIKKDLQKKEDRQKTEKEAYLLWEADGKPEGKSKHYWELAIYKIKTEESLINKVKKFLVNNWVRGGTILTILAAFGAFALTMREKEFDRFSLVKPVFEVEELEDKNFKLFNHHRHSIVFFIGCNQKYRNKKRDKTDKRDKLNDVLFNQLKTTPKQYSSLSKENWFKFIFNKEIEINEGDYFICFYRDIDENLYELEIVYIKNPDTNTNSKSFYIRRSPFVYRSDLFVTMSQKWLWLDAIVSFIFPKDWYTEHKRLKDWFNECKAYSEEYKLGTIDKCLTVKYNSSDS